MYTHSCVRCGAHYQDEDPDPYYCTPCNEERKRIAKEVDSKIRPSTHIKGNWAMFEESQGIQAPNGMVFKKF